MKLSATVSSSWVLLALAYHATTQISCCEAEKPKCGQWYSTDCLGDSDPRYDSGYTNDLKELNPIWGRYEGYYVVEWDYALLFPGAIDMFANAPYISNAPFSRINPYGKPIAFYNETIIGSRYYSNRYYIFPPADPAFCSRFPPSMNVAPESNGTCGVNGFSQPAGTYGVTSYEKDGTLDLIGSTGMYEVDSIGFAQKTSNLTPVDDITISQSLRIPTGVSSSTWVLLSDFTEMAYSSNVYSGDLQSRGTTRGVARGNSAQKVSREEWLDMIEFYYDNYTVLEEDRVQGGQLPMQTYCNTPGNCPTEVEWCQFDPACSVSPYQEPDAELKAGPIVGIVLAGVFVLFLLMLAFFRYKLKRTEARARTLLTRRIAETIELRTSNRVLTPEALATEFQKIDEDHDGSISKEDLWNFLQSGKAGEITEAEFKVLFAAIDHGRDGKVDFIEFVSYFGKCNEEFEGVKNNQSIRQVRASFAVTASQRLGDTLSKSQFIEMPVVEELEDAAAEGDKTQVVES